MFMGWFRVIRLDQNVIGTRLSFFLPVWNRASDLPESFEFCVNAEN
jgi:hypothetical protein